MSARIRDAHGDVYPFQVEGAASVESDVRRSALVAKEGKRVLLVELKPGADPGTPQKLLARLVWARLDRVVACEKIPTDRRHHSKVDYTALAALSIPRGNHASERSSPAG
jgi:hypothetical protein